VSKLEGNLILIVDDQPEDQSVLTWGLRRLGIQNPIFCLQDGHETIRYFNGEGRYSDRTNYPLPAVLFLDLKLPVVSGWEVLDWMHGCGLKGDCLIFVCTQFSHVSGMQRVYDLGADSFIKKPIHEVDLMNLIYHFPRPWRIQAAVTPGARGLTQS
jgi:CheY-like chemotaxis protein